MAAHTNGTTFSVQMWMGGSIGKLKRFYENGIIAMLFSFFNILNLSILDSGEIKLMKFKLMECWGWVCSSAANCSPSMFEALAQCYTHTKLRGNIFVSFLVGNQQKQHQPPVHSSAT